MADTASGSSHDGPEDALAALAAQARDRLLDEARRRAGSTSTASRIAGATGLDVRRVRKLLAGNVAVALSDVVALAAGLGLDLFDFLPRTRDELIPQGLRDGLAGWQPGTRTPPVPQAPDRAALVRDAALRLLDRFTTADAGRLLTPAVVVSDLLGQLLDLGVSADRLDQMAPPAARPGVAAAGLADDTGDGSVILCLKTDEDVPLAVARAAVLHALGGLAIEPAANRIAMLLLRSRHAAALAVAASAPDLDEGRDIVVPAAAIHYAGAAGPPPGALPEDLAATVLLNTTGRHGSDLRAIVCRLK